MPHRMLPARRRRGRPSPRRPGDYYLYFILNAGWLEREILLPPFPEGGPGAGSWTLPYPPGRTSSSPAARRRSATRPATARPPAAPSSSSAPDFNRHATVAPNGVGYNLGSENRLVAIDLKGRRACGAFPEDGNQPYMASLLPPPRRVTASATPGLAPVSCLARRSSGCIPGVGSRSNTGALAVSASSPVPSTYSRHGVEGSAKALDSQPRCSFPARCYIVRSPSPRPCTAQPIPVISIPSERAGLGLRSPLGAVLGALVAPTISRRASGSATALTATTPGP